MAGGGLDFAIQQICKFDSQYMALETWDLPFLWMASGIFALILPLLIILPILRKTIPIPVLILLCFVIWMAYRPSMYSVHSKFTVPNSAATESVFEVRNEPWLVYSGENFWLGVSPGNDNEAATGNYIACKIVRLNSTFAPKGNLVRRHDGPMSWTVVSEKSTTEVKGTLHCHESRDQRGTVLGPQVAEINIELSVLPYWQRLAVLGLLSILLAISLYANAILVYRRLKK